MAEEEEQEEQEQEDKNKRIRPWERAHGQKKHYYCSKSVISKKNGDNLPLVKMK